MTTMTASRAHRLPAAAMVAFTALMGTGLVACSAEAQPTASAHAAEHARSNGQTSSQAALHAAMREVWAEHMEWTYATVAAFAANTDGLPATLERLLQNQKDIGDAIKPFYGDEAGAALTTLLEAHINGAVPILVAAKAGNTADLNKAVAAWYANANEIADFLAGANPQWAQADMRQMMKGHIDQTLVYATDQLQGKYADSIEAYGAAEAHMLEMADMLSDGLIAQFPKEFKK